MLNCLIKRNHNLAVVFLDETTSEDEVLLAELEKIDGETKKYDIDFVKVEKSLYNSLLTPFQCDTNPMMSWFLCELFPPARLRTTTRPPTTGSACSPPLSTSRTGFPPSTTLTWLK